jgi:uncharacterized protein YraI
MTMNKQILLPIVAGAAILGFAEAATASPAVITATVNIRSGPGIYYYVIGTAYRGQYVDVRGCQSGWCYIEKRGPDGWVSARYLGGGSSGPSVNFYLDFGYGPWFGPRPGPGRGPGPGPGLPGPGGPGGPGGPPGLPPMP